MLYHIVSWKLIDVPEVHTASITRVIMEAVSTSEMLVNFYQTTWGNIPEDTYFHTCHHENLKSHKKYGCHCYLVGCLNDWYETPVSECIKKSALLKLK
jgi:hypothetical protein